MKSSGHYEKRATLHIEFISPIHMLHNSDITHVHVLAVEGGKRGDTADDRLDEMF